MVTSRKRAIARSFSRAATTYAAAAQAQERAAERLAGRLPPLPAAARVLELGCGTGLLTRHLLALMPPSATLLATDLSPGMIAAASAAISDPRLSFAVMDAEAPDDFADGFDLIASSLAAQWFADLPATLAGLVRRLNPGGMLALATLGDGTFAEWRAAHAAHGVECGVPLYPDTAGLAACLPGCRAEAAPFTIAYPDARAFLATLAAIGAATPRPGHRPLPPGTLRRIMAAMGRPCAITWDVLTLTFVKRNAA